MKFWFGMVVALFAGLAQAIAPVRSADGVWSVPVAESEILSLRPTEDGAIPPRLHVWSNGKVEIASVADAQAVDGVDRFFRVTSDGRLTSVMVDGGFDLEDSVLEFRYRLSGKLPVVSVGAEVRVKEWKNRLVGIRLVPTYDAWRSESFPLARLMQGDTWRMGTARTAGSVELGFIAKGRGVCLDLAGIRIVRRPAAFSPLVRPAWLTGAGTFNRRVTVPGRPEKAWLMAHGPAGFEVRVNGRRIGTGPVDTAQEGWRSHGRLNPAADQWPLDGVLAAGENTVAFTRNGDAGARGMVVLGWESDGRRHIVVSDDQWTRDGMPARTEAIPDSKHPLRLDIYPLRPADAWRPPAVRPDYSAVPSYSPTNALLRIRPEAGAWGVTRDKSGRWFLKTPSGRPFFYYGMQTVHAMWPNYGYADWARRAYPDEKTWARDAVGLVIRLGFNGVGVAASSRSAFDEAASRGLVNLEHIGCADGGPRLYNARGESLFGMADPFDPAFERILRERLAACAADWNARNDVFAICVGNEAHIEGNVQNRTSSGYVYSKACGAEFVRWLEERYGGDLAALNAAWFGPVASKHLASFGDVLARRSDPFKDMPRVDDPEYAAAMAHLGKAESVRVAKSRMKDDFDAFAVHVVGRYASIVLACMRETFPKKLIASNRFMGGATREMYACWKDYDVIAVNSYPLEVEGEVGFTARKVRLLRDAHEATGRPVLLTEWGVLAKDVNLQSPLAPLHTQKERGQGYVKVLRQVVEELPFVAGMVPFGFQHLADSEGQGWGMVDNEGRPYRDYMDGMLQAVRWLDGYLSVIND